MVYVPVKISNVDNNPSHTLKIDNEKNCKNRTIIVNTKSHDQMVFKSVNDAQNVIFSQPRLYRLCYPLLMSTNVMSMSCSLLEYFTMLVVR
jgi:hypothetical protein